MKIRLNLEKGLNHNKWKIYDDDNAEFISTELSFILSRCKLVNNKNIAIKINQGEDKSVCAWIEFEEFKFIQNYNYKCKRNIKFNPRKNPFWEIDGQDVDNILIQKIIVIKKKLYF